MNNNYEYGKLEGALLFIYWCCIGGGALLIVCAGLSLIPALGTLFLTFSIFGVLSILAYTVAFGVGGLLFILAGNKLKKGSFDFYDTYLTGQIILVIGSIASEIFAIFSYVMDSSLITTTFSQILSLVICVCISVMYLSKSERVKAYFGERPLPHSKYWGYIQQLPPALTSEAPIDMGDINIPKPDFSSNNTSAEAPEDTAVELVVEEEKTEE